ncbi:MAG: hypothetical protein ISEC1_P0665 [Thiomicrorhabdus sp.]|nr:MAG: hypothetical protein ISEC1_P0665 [Thiomicrorhabdus sp.]
MIRQLSKTTLLSVCLLILTAFGSVKAEIVSQIIQPSKIKAVADYVVGDPNKPAILILHGFLTTNQFHTITAISNILQEEEFSTLAPNLTLRIPQRRDSIKCNSIHTNTLEDDVIEVKDWVNWLKAQGHKKIILLGHSSGSSSLLQYLHENEDSAIILAIFTSLFYLNGAELGIQNSDIAAAKLAVAAQDNYPRNYSFNFCQKNYYATPNSFLSYLKMDRQYTLDTLNSLKIPNYTIMAGEDKRYNRVGLEWLKELRATSTKLVIINGTNHFFSGEYELDFQDSLINVINGY